jgi:hypothetical protein
VVGATGGVTTGWEGSRACGVASGDAAGAGAGVGVVLVLTGRLVSVLDTARDMTRTVHPVHMASSAAPMKFLAPK